MRNFDQGSWHLDWKSVPGPPEYKAGVLTTQLQCSVPH